MQACTHTRAHARKHVCTRTRAHTPSTVCTPLGFVCCFLFCLLVCLCAPSSACVPVCDTAVCVLCLCVRRNRNMQTTLQAKACQSPPPNHFLYSRLARALLSFWLRTVNALNKQTATHFIFSQIMCGRVFVLPQAGEARLGEVLTWLGLFVGNVVCRCVA